MDTDIEVKLVSEEAEKLLAAVIDKISVSAVTALKGTDETSNDRLFFPNGITLINLKFKVGKKIEVTLSLAGKEVPRRDLDLTTTVSHQISEGGWISAG